MPKVVSMATELVKAGRLYATVDKTVTLDDGRVVTYKTVADDKATDLVLVLPDNVVAQIVRQSVNQALRNAAIAAATEVDKRLRETFEALKGLRPDLTFEDFKAKVLDK
jgi:hypothetical protein